MGKHRILEELGEGPMSHVFLADDSILFRQVALKVLKPEFARAPSSMEPVEEEISAAAVLLHSGIVPLYGTGHDRDHHYYTMTLMPGGNLRHLIQEGMTPQRALVILNQVARALAFAHNKGINHQGVKPENILFRRDGSAVLSDFKISKIHGFGIGALAHEAEPHPFYISPEQIQKSGKQFGRSDLYSLGIVLYEMLTGEPPFRGDNAHWLHMNAPIPSLEGSLSRYQPLLNKLLAKNPSERHADAAEVARAAEQLGSYPEGNRNAKVTPFPVAEKRREPPEETPPPELWSSPLEVLEFESLVKAESPTAPSSAPAEPLAAASAKAPPSPHPPKVETGGVPPVKKERRAPLPQSSARRPRWVASIASLAAAGLLTGWLMNVTAREGGDPTPSSEPLLAPPAAMEPEAEADVSKGPSPSPEALSTPEPQTEATEQFAQAAAYSKIGRPGEAALLYRRMTEIFPLLPAPYNNLAAIYASEGRLREAQQVLEEAFRANPTYATLFENLNTVNLELSLTGDLPPGPRTASAPRLQPLEHLSPGGSFANPVRRPEATEPLPAPPSPHVAEEARSVAEAVLTPWSKAWEQQDLEGYLNRYAQGFQPEGGLSRQEWERQRQQNVRRPSWIEVTLSEIHASYLSQNLIRAVVVQEYRSDLYRDKTMKALTLAREETGWGIVEERTLGTFR